MKYGTVLLVISWVVLIPAFMFMGMRFNAWLITLWAKWGWL